LRFSPSLTLVVPFYNERDNLPRVLGDLLTMGRASCARFEILCVDDGSSDGSAEVVPRAPEVRVVTHPENRGLTAALRTGFQAAASDYVTWVPADGQIPASEVAKILAACDGHDLVLSTYRHRPDGILRLAMSRGLRLLLWAGVGLTDRVEGTYLFKRALVDELRLVSRSSAGSVAFEIAAKCRRLKKRITSTEIECVPRLSGRSKVANARNIAATLGEIWRIRQSMKGLH
jgi:glycosyltransferase involved in cell wall biosynthesis